jgi:hypothetical protein
VAPDLHRLLGAYVLCSWEKVPFVR